MAATDRAVGPALQRDHHRPAPAFDHARGRSPAAGGSGSGAAMRAGGQCREQRLASGAATRAVSSKRTATRAATSPRGARHRRTASVS